MLKKLKEVNAPPENKAQTSHSEEISSEAIVYEKYGRISLPLAVLTITLILRTKNFDRAILDSFLSIPLDASTAFGLTLGLTLNLVRELGVLALLVSVSIFSAFSSARPFVATRRATGRVTLAGIDRFSRLGHHIYTRRHRAFLTMAVSATIGAVLVTAAYYGNEKEAKKLAAHQAFTTAQNHFITNSLIHYRNRIYFDPIVISKNSLALHSPTYFEALESLKHPSICLYNLLETATASSPDAWQHVLTTLADLPTRVPEPLRDYCKNLNEYSRQPVRNHLYLTSTAALYLTAARINEYLALEGTIPTRQVQAANLYLQIESLYTSLDIRVPTDFRIAIDNGIGNYFSTCFARFQEMNCASDTRPGSLMCDTDETCFTRSHQLYSSTYPGSNSTYTRTRTENNSADLKMKALIRFPTTKLLPQYASSTLFVGSQRRLPAEWLSEIVVQLENRAFEAQIVPEIYVTLAQLISVQLFFDRFYLSSHNHDMVLDMVSQAIDYLVLAWQTHALRGDFLTTNPRDRGWCGLASAISHRSTFSQQQNPQDPIAETDRAGGSPQIHSLEVSRERLVGLLQELGEPSAPSWPEEVANLCR